MICFYYLPDLARSCGKFGMPIVPSRVEECLNNAECQAADGFSIVIPHQGKDLAMAVAMLKTN
jgi:hypothetical protein